MTTKSKPPKKGRKLPVDWAPATHFRLAPKVVSTGKDRQLKSCTIAISTRKPIPPTPQPPGLSIAAEA